MTNGVATAALCAAHGAVWSGGFGDGYQSPRDYL